MFKNYADTLVNSEDNDYRRLLFWVCTVFRDTCICNSSGIFLFQDHNEEKFRTSACTTLTMSFKKLHNFAKCFSFVQNV